MFRLFRNRKLSKEDERSLEQTICQILFFEKKYGMRSEEFFSNWRKSKKPMPVEASVANLWAAYYASVDKGVLDGSRERVNR